MKRQVLLIILDLLVLTLISCGDRVGGARYGQRPIVQNQKTQRSHRSSRSNGRNNSEQGSRNDKRQRSEQSQTVISTAVPSKGEIDGPDMFEKYNSAVFMVYTSDGWNGYQGSGFFISSDGVAVSNYHVFEGTSIGGEQIKLTDDKVYKIKEVLAKNSDDDIIVFRVDGKGRNFNCIPIAKQTPRVGEKVFALGSPRGLENTFSSGEISQIRDNDLLQISVPIDHGSSGGVLLNTRGEAVGITSAGIDESGANLNFAININVLKRYVKL